MNNYKLFEIMPENKKSISMPNKNNKVTFVEESNHNQTQLPQSKMVRPKTVLQQPKVTYEDILSKMGMFVNDGKLHLKDNNFYKNKEYNIDNIDNIDNNDNNSQNHYINNKYFKNSNDTYTNIRVPKNVIEYRNMLIHDIIQKQRIKQIKSTKLIMPTTNINIGYNSSNLNKLFSFSN